MRGDQVEAGRDVDHEFSALKTASMSSTRGDGGHKRSKSASDKILDIAPHGASNCSGKECKECCHKERPYVPSTQHVQRENFKGASLNHRASLENDIKNLQLHLYQEKSARNILERTIGRASSTLSPGHRHFASQTRELIEEIELLEEEIADREQHVLSLYRSIFDQCVSTATSTQSSGKSSPAHVKTETRKHPSIISSSFCSSKKFPLQHFQVLGSIKESGKNSVDKYKGGLVLSARGSKSSHIANISQVSSKFANMERGYLTQTLRDHLYQCPSKLSEELVRCMAAIYYWLRSDSSAKSDRAFSPFLSRSSTSIVLPRQGNGESRTLPCRPTMEISSISMRKDQFSSASNAIYNYRLLVEQLERVDVGSMENNAKLAFWLNVYNSLVMHVYLAYGTSTSTLRRMTLFHKASYKIGGHCITANSIEYSILCCRTNRIGRWFELILSTAMRKKAGDAKQLLESTFGLFTPEPLVLFALCTGAASDPSLRVYSAKNIMDELEKAKRDFLQSSVIVESSRKILLPKILDRYAKEVSMNIDDLLKWISHNVDKKMNEAIQKCMDSKGKRKALQVIEWLPYNTKFRYVIGKELMEKPSWV